MSKNKTVLSNEQAALLKDTGATKDQAIEVLEGIRDAASKREFADGKAIIGDHEWAIPLILADPVIKKLDLSYADQEELGIRADTEPSLVSAILEDPWPTLELLRLGLIGAPSATALDKAEKDFNDQLAEEKRKHDAAEKISREGDDKALKSDEYLASRYRFAEQCYLIYHMAELAARHQISQTNPAGAGVFPHYTYKKTHLLTGKGSTILNKLRARPGSERLLDAMPAELSSLIPKIALYKVVYGGESDNVGEIDYEVPIKFLSHTLTDEYKDSTNILQPASGRTGVGIKSFDWEFIATNPDTIRNDIKAKLVLFFQSFDDLIATRTAFVNEQDREYKYLDLIVHPKRGSTPANMEADVPDGHACDQARIDYRSTFYEIRATVGWSAETNGLDDEMRSSVAFNQTSLYLTLLDHSFNIEQDGTFTLTIEYRGRMDGMLSGPRANILLTGGGPGAFTQSSFAELVHVNTKIGELKKKGGEVCADESTLKERIEELKEEKVKLEDSLRVLSYKRFASDLLDPSPYYKEGYPMVSGESPPRAQPLLYTVPVTRKQIAVFADRGRTYQADNLEFSDVASASEGDVLGQMRDQIDNDSDAVGGGIVISGQRWFGQEFKVSGGEFETTLKDYSILEDYKPRGSTLNKESVSLVQFFFLGDLIDILATIVLNNTKDKVIGDAQQPAHTLPDGTPYSDQPVSALGRQDGLQDFVDKYCFNKSEVEKTRILLGPLEYRDGKGNIIRINIGDIPISWRMFVDFCHRKIIKPRKQTYSFIAFIRDMVKDLAIRALGAECFGEQGRKGVRMRVGFLEGPAMEGGGDPIVGKAIEVSAAADQLAHFWEEEESSMSLPMSPTSDTPFQNTVRLNMDPVGYHSPVFDYTQSAETKDTYQYIVIYTEGPSGLVHPSYTEPGHSPAAPPDEPNPALIDRTIRGIHHLHFGRDRGLVKSIQFSKTDSPYLREARVEKAGTFDPILQLSDVYEVTIKMYGNVYFYPGSYIYINPFGMGSDSLGFPWARGHISNIMGLGGYHIIINVSSYIEEGNYETTIKARFDCSGDGCRTTSAGADNDTICPDQPASTPSLEG